MKNSFIKGSINFILILTTQLTIAASDTSTIAPEERIRLLEERIAILEHKQDIDEKNRPIDPVLALPQVNLKDKYDSAPIYDQDLAMLKMRKLYDIELKRRKIKPLPYPHIELGGSIIGLGVVRTPPNFPPLDGHRQSDINLAGANLNVTAEIMEALLGSLRISYNPNVAERVTERTILTRVANSSIFINTAFLTFGDLNRFPFYLSIGQMFLPFGEYNSTLLTAPLTARLGRFRERPILIGFQEPGAIAGFNASVFVFRGDTILNGKLGVINNGGANMGYSYVHPLFRFSTGTSFIANIADSGGMQNTGPSTIVTDAGEWTDNDYLDEDDEEDIEESQPIFISINTFRGFGAQPALLRTVPAVDGRARLDLKFIPFSLYGELVMPTRAFAVEDLSFNGYEARPRAWNAEVAWRFTLWDYLSSLTVGYSRSQEALALNFPEKTVGATFRIRFRRYLGLAIGYQYEVAYPSNSFATGQLLPVNADRFVGTSTRTWFAQVNARF